MAYETKIKKHEYRRRRYNEPYKIGDKVKVKSDNDNDNYNSFRYKVLTITHIDKDFDKEGGYLYSFKDEKGNEIGNSLYDWEFEKV